jgi:iron complex transport system substrate-binding protein
MMRQFPPSRIVCLTEETVETLYLLGEQDRIVGVSGYAVRPPQVRREKPRVSTFTSADIPKILALEPGKILLAAKDALDHGTFISMIRSDALPFNEVRHSG